LTTKTMHENEHYTVGIVGSEYAVVNKETNIVEFSTASLPEAIHSAEALNDALIVGAWKWFAVRRQALAEGRIADENEVFLQTMEQQHARVARSRGSSEELVK
jgi:hypothetical protein